MPLFEYVPLYDRIRYHLYKRLLFTLAFLTSSGRLCINGDVLQSEERINFLEKVKLGDVKDYIKNLFYSEIFWKEWNDRSFFLF